MPFPSGHKPSSFIHMTADQGINIALCKARNSKMAGGRAEQMTKAAKAA